MSIIREKSDTDIKMDKPVRSPDSPVRNVQLYRRLTFSHIHRIPFLISDVY